MKKILEFIVYIFYNYYNKGATQSIAYPSALMGLSLLLYINIATIIVALGIDYSKISPVIENCGRGVRLLSGFLLWVPFSLLLKIFLRKEVIQNKNYARQNVKIGGFLLVLYILFSMILLTILIIK